MNTKIVFLFAGLILTAFAGCVSNATRTDSLSERVSQRYAAREDSTTWDEEMLASDPRFMDCGPLNNGVFPVSKYKLLGEGTFTGLDFTQDYRPFGECGNYLIYSAFLVKRNTLNDAYIPDGKVDEVFFMVVVLSDAVIDTVDYSHCSNAVTSRNNPDFVGQGSIATRAAAVDYVAFLTVDRNQYALVNMRLFDLKRGRVVLIAPHRDGSLRSMQIRPQEVLSSAEVESYLDGLLQEKAVADFFNAQGVI